MVSAPFPFKTSILGNLFINRLEQIYILYPKNPTQEYSLLSTRIQHLSS